MDHNESSDRDDELDPALEQRFAEFTDGNAPDVWARVKSAQALGPDSTSRLPAGGGDDESEIVVTDHVRYRSNTMLRIAAAVLFLLGFGYWGRSLVSGSEGAQIEMAEGSSPTTSAQVPTSEPAACDAEQLQSRLQSGLMLADHDTTASFEDLVARSEWWISGSLVNAYGYDGGSILTLEGNAVHEIWIPSRVQAGPLDGAVLAFFSQEQVLGPNGKLPVVLPEGLWIACEPDEPALPGLAAPVEPGWEQTVGSATLEDLVGLAIDLELQASIEPTFTDENVAVYRIIVNDLELRLSIPISMAGDLEGNDSLSIESPQGGLLRISGENFEIMLSLADYCEGVDPTAVSLNALGSWVQFLDGGITICRPIDSLKATISPVLPDVDDDLFDIRFLDRGDTQRLDEYGPGIPEIGPWRVGSIVTRVGDAGLVGLNPETLEEMWRYESDSEVLWPTVRQSALLVGENTRLVRLDPASGETLWTAEFPDDGNAAYLLDAWDGRVLRFANGDNEVPEHTSAIEKIDVATGEVLWRATGRPGGVFSDTVPIQTNGIVLAGELLNNAPAGGLTTHAIDDVTGEVLWVSDFEIGDARYTTEGGFASFIVTSDGTALIMRTVNQGVVRVDPKTGETLWSAVVQWGPIIGRRMSSDGVSLGVAIRTPDGVILLNPMTGERLAN